MRDILKVLALGLALCGMECNAQTVSGQVEGHDYVDLGLPSGTKWATFNVGATKPTEYGDYFAWGEIKPKEVYHPGTYKWKKEGSRKFTKYVAESDYGTDDDKKDLEVDDDAATANWGSAWRMPTLDETRELKYGCDWEWTDNYNGTGIAGQVGTSKANGNKFFLPAAGYYSGTQLCLVGSHGDYWTSSLKGYHSDNANQIFFVNEGISRTDTYRECGMTVRAVVK